MDEATVARDTLKQWVVEKKLSSVKLSDDGRELLLVGDSITGSETASLPGTCKVLIEHGGKSCQYTLASIYLQIIDPNQGLMAYRNACKKFQVSDIIKALDKPIVVGYFLATTSETDTTSVSQIPATTTTTETAAPGATFPNDDNKKAASEPSSQSQDIPVDGLEATGEKLGAADGSAPAAASASASGDTAAPNDHHHRDRHDGSKHHKSSINKDDRKRSSSSSGHKHSSSSHHHHHRKDSHHHSSKRKDHHHRPPGADNSANNKKKKAKTMVTNEELFEHLNVVVDKRSLDQIHSESQLDQENAGGAGGINNSTDTNYAMAEEELLAIKSREEIGKALSAEGFEVTPEMLEESRKRTAAIQANEIAVGDSASILRALNPRKDLRRVLELYNETVQPSSSAAQSQQQRKGKGSLGAGIAAPVPSLTARKPARPYLIGKKPVIVVPKAMTAPLTMINAHEFLCNAKFVPRDVMLKQQGRSALQQQQKSTTFTRKVSTLSGATMAPLEFEIMDNPRNKLGHDVKEWERIVAVIVLGQAWQFKDWKSPAYNSPATLFDSVFGFYVSLEGDKLPPEINQWAVQQSKLNRDKRGLDSVTHASFWNGLNEWMKVKRPELLPQVDS